MKHSVGLTLALTLIVSTAAARDTTGRLVGKWTAHSMRYRGESRPVPKGIKVLLEFVKDGSFIGTVEATLKDGRVERKVERGSWEARGTTLITTTTKAGKKKVEEVLFELKGDALTLTNQARGGEQLLLKRNR